MITTGCHLCDEKQAETNNYTALCDKHRLESLEYNALTAINHYLDKGLTGDANDYNYRKAKWAQRRKRLANLLNQIELCEKPKQLEGPLTMKR